MVDSPRLDIAYIAKLARLNLTPSEKNSLSRELADVLDHIAKLSEMDLEGVEPTFQTTGLTDSLREDEVDESRILSSEEALSGTAEKKNGMFKVPKII